ncbi:DUF2000 domain-containing protein [Klebsiella aerogenes]|uniref:DUF2000 domain-containing protein n=1 Tax=Klebsiella aerogenes TaxID=548 RepID=UPI00063C9523|nr:DUF2000 domain-containing protein [Klebsiella aerogenes]EDI4631223.1 DUF2000 domain-containing protein [Salmonella enterica subsp. enterica serovar Poona]EDT7187077.1 DUF2000 domain-containing protein [Salmonella enterica subsp. enterica]EJO0601017.1 DUF2000 domain-containing protein [Salmonella enterica]HCZ4970210.1 DUF2000 domain-containing protein [Salmonella enterica subsp. enterica serovar Saintpaul str. CFSAN004160]EKP5434215.1 DUF2000 domain-containing protein [Salmonella enterica]
MFDTKIAFIVRDDLQAWQKLNVVAFLATGIASSASEIIGSPYIDAAGHHYGSMSGQPMLIFGADREALQKVRKKGLEREMLLIPYVQAMFSTGRDDDNRAVFLAEDADNMDLVGLAVHGQKKVVDKVIKGLSLHK